jgi:hypothetical protein
LASKNIAQATSWEACPTIKQNGNLDYAKLPFFKINQFYRQFYLIISDDF